MANVCYRVDGKRVYYGVDGKRVERGWGWGSMAYVWEGGGGGVHVSTHLPEFLSSIMYLYMSRKALRAVTGQVL